MLLPPHRPASGHGRPAALRRGLILLAALLAGSGDLHAGPFTGGPTLNDPLVHRATKFAFPARFDTFVRALPRQYDAQGQDFSVAYDSILPPVSITVFVYPVAGRTLADELTRRQGEISILHPDARLLAHGPAALAPQKAPALSASYRYHAVYGEDEQAVCSDVVLARHGDRFVAYRIVYPAAARKIAAPAVLKFEQTFPWP